MTFFVVIAIIIAAAALAPRFGTDSRDLRDHPWEQLPVTLPRRRAAVLTRSEAAAREASSNTSRVCCTVATTHSGPPHHLPVREAEHRPAAGRERVVALAVTLQVLRGSVEGEAVGLDRDTRLTIDEVGPDQAASDPDLSLRLEDVSPAASRMPRSMDSNGLSARRSAASATRRRCCRPAPGRSGQPRPARPSAPTTTSARCRPPQGPREGHRHRTVEHGAKGRRRAEFEIAVEPVARLVDDDSGWRSRGAEPCGTVTWMARRADELDADELCRARGDTTPPSLAAAANSGRKAGRE